MRARDSNPETIPTTSLILPNSVKHPLSPPAIELLPEELNRQPGSDAYRIARRPVNASDGRIAWP